MYKYVYSVSDGMRNWPRGTVVMSSANGLVGTGSNQSGFLKAYWVGVWPLHPLLSH